ncbi:hypothetical protein [Dawidia soli]|uniref:Lipoprotein n=1 Tax=Dawidia soli TaxID=2782352 RepID=A0AAP2DDA9_9BACT|nr:hypothetical protein [Dawidia soli]MBT1688630.1 hypothetical protein [Dawidia soli]
MKKLIILWASLVIILAACNGDDDDAPQAAKDFPRDTEWVGVLSGSGYQYPPPANLRFKENDKLVVYAPHFFVEDGAFIRADSVNGSVTSITEIDGATIEVKADIEHYGQTTMTIQDRHKLTAISSNANKPVPFTLELYDTPASLEGTVWSGPVMTGPGPMAGLVAYPDLSTIIFDENTTSYTRNGALVPEQPTPQIPAPGVLQVLYKKNGASVFMSGYDETGMYLYGYFGVLLPGNDKMMVYSGAAGARLPYYTQTIAWYGPIGQTPIIEKQ